MKKILVACVALSLAGCVTTRSCNERVQKLVATSSAMCKSDITEVNVQWMVGYCKMVVAEEERYAKITKAKTIRVPEFCVNAGLDK